MSRNPPKYFTYHDYITVKKSFVYDPDGEFNISFVNDIIKRIHNTLEKELLLHKTFYELKKFISRNHSFLEYGKEKCCNYINYWLNKTVRDSEYGVNKEKFKFFDEFMQRDPKASDGPFNCISKLSYMDTDSFQKMKKLYDLYDYFTELKEHEDSSTLCRSISDLAKKYESMMREYEKDNKLCNMLTNLRGVIERDKLVAKDICEKNTFDSFILKIDPPREEQKEVTAHAYRGISGEARPPKHSSVSSPQVHRGISVETRPTNPVSASLPQAHGRSPGETHTRPLVTAPSSRVHDRNSVQTPTPTAVSVSLSQAKGLERQAGGESERTLSVPQEQFPRPLPLLLPQPSLEQSEPLESSEADEYGGPKGLTETESELQQEPQEQGYRPGYGVYHFSKDGRYISPEEGYPPADSMMPTFNTDSIIGTIKDAVSNVLESVEPVPVLGVSGGMGALYLLFK
ncbi:PIR protein, partial [Plasmodium vivax]